jgi:hypothetical protein
MPSLNKGGKSSQKLSSLGEDFDLARIEGFEEFRGDQVNAIVYAVTGSHAGAWWF